MSVQLTLQARLVLLSHPCLPDLLLLPTTTRAVLKSTCGGEQRPFLSHSFWHALYVIHDTVIGYSWIILSVEEFHASRCSWLALLLAGPACIKLMVL
jgi:hypothetical protein